MRTKSFTRSMTGRRAGAAAAPMLLIGCVVLGVIAFVVLSNHKPADGPVPVVWDKTPCAFCAMHIGDPRFAAQLATEDGTTYFYDDPGCLFLHQRALAAVDTGIRARWFHELDRDAWLEAAEVAFQRSEYSPMDYGFGAVRQGSPDSITLDSAATEVFGK